MFTCGTCKRDVPKESLVERLLKANKKQCMGCHALKSRIARLVKADGDGELEGLSDLTPETTVQLIKDGENMYGPALKALLIQAITQSEIESQKSNFAAQWTFEPLQDVEERMKDRPEELASLKANSKIITDPYFNVKRIWVPNFSLSLNDERESRVERNRKVEAETTLKPPKKRKKSRATQRSSPTTRPPATTPATTPTTRSLCPGAWSIACKQARQSSRSRCWRSAPL